MMKPENSKDHVLLLYHCITPRLAITNWIKQTVHDWYFLLLLSPFSWYRVLPNLVLCVGRTWYWAASDFECLFHFNARVSQIDSQGRSFRDCCRNVHVNLIVRSTFGFMLMLRGVYRQIPSRQNSIKSHHRAEMMRWWAKKSSKRKPH